MDFIPNPKAPAVEGLYALTISANIWRGINFNAPTTPSCAVSGSINFATSSTGLSNKAKGDFV